MRATKKYATRMRVSTGVTAQSFILLLGSSGNQQDGMTSTEIETLLTQVANGAIDPAAARHRLVQALRARPLEDLGFARVDHHRAIRQGFPEVILGIGKTPAQIAAIATEIVRHGSSLLVTRAAAAA